MYNVHVHMSFSCPDFDANGRGRSKRGSKGEGERGDGGGGDACIKKTSHQMTGEMVLAKLVKEVDGTFLSFR